MHSNPAWVPRGLPEMQSSTLWRSSSRKVGNGSRRKTRRRLRSSGRSSVQSHEQDNAFLMKKLRYMTDAISEGTGAVINDDAVFSDDSTLRTMYAGSEAVDVVDKILGLSEKWHGWGDEWGEETEEEVEAGIREFNGGESEDEEDEDEDEDEEESDEGDEEEDDEEEEEDPDDDVILIGEKKSGEQRITLSVEGE